MSIRLKASEAGAAAGAAAQRLSHGLVFAAGGLLRVADFQQSASRYYDHFNTDPADIAEGLNALESRVYGRVVKPGARLCIIGCGTGRDLLPFVAAGHEVVGVEPAGAAVRSLRDSLFRAGLTANVIHGLAENADLPSEFDVIILSPHCYSYIPGSQRRVALLSRLSQHLAPGGCLAINFMHRRTSWSHTGVRIAGAIAHLTGSDCPWEPYDVVTWASGTILFEHYFLPAELHAEGARAGLRVIDAEVDPFLGPISVLGR